MILNNFMTALFKIINNTENKDTNFVIAYSLLTHIKEIENMKLQDMADACYVSTYTLMQFFKKFGFNKLSIAKKIPSKHYDVRFYQFK